MNVNKLKKEVVQFVHVLQSQRPLVQACTVLPTTKLSGLPLSPSKELRRNDLPVRHLPATAITASGDGMPFRIWTASSWTVYCPLSSDVINWSVEGRGVVAERLSAMRGR